MTYIRATVLLAAVFTVSIFPQQKPLAASEAGLPDVPTLLKKVQDHQKQVDAVRENYTYRQIETTNELDSGNHVKKTEVREFEVFFVNGHEIQRLVKKDGKDLTSGEESKEQRRVEKEIAKASKAAKGKTGEDGQISVTRILAIMKISNPRRISLNGRNTLAFDFTGDPKAQTHGLAEDASKKLAGTIWVDEKDYEVARLAVHFDDNFRVGGGLVASVQKGSSFEFAQAPINGELWLPSAGSASISARVALFKGLHQTTQLQFKDYRKFQTDAAQQPGVTVVSGKTHP